MATTYKSTQVTQGDTPRAVSPGVFNAYGYYIATGSSLIINDVIQMVKVPIGARILQIDLYSTDLDSDSTPAVTLSVGDGTTPARFITASTVGQAGGNIHFPSVSTTTAAGVGYQYTVNDTIDIAVTAAPTATATTFHFHMNVLMSIDQPD
jgi:hypothetical protein